MLKTRKTQISCTSIIFREIVTSHVGKNMFVNGNILRNISGKNIFIKWQLNWLVLKLPSSVANV